MINLQKHIFDPKVVTEITGCTYLTDNNLKGMINLIKLEGNTNFTDKGLKHIPNLKILYCGGNTNFTDGGLKHIPNLKILYCGGNTNFTDKGLKHVPNLEVLCCNENFTDNGLKNVPNLISLHIDYNKKLNENELLIMYPRLLVNY
jgi:hypothetical protein